MTVYLYTDINSCNAVKCERVENVEYVLDGQHIKVTYKSGNVSFFRASNFEEVRCCYTSSERKEARS